MIRRVLSILLYGFGGLCLASGSLMAFVTPIAGHNKLGLVWDFGPWVIVPVALGCWASPGNWVREIGLVLQGAAGLVALPMTTIAQMPEEFPPEAQAFFGDPATGWTLIAAMAAAGTFLALSARMWASD